MPSYRRTILFRLECDPVLRIHSGFAPLRVPANDREASVQIYTGAGWLLDAPAIKQVINGSAERYDFALSGVPAETLRFLLEDKESVSGAFLDIGWAIHDSDWQITDIEWRARFIADVPSVDSAATENGRERTIKLSVRQADTSRANPQLAYWTHAEQTRLHLGDLIFDHVAGINAGTTRTFGPDD